MVANEPKAHRATANELVTVTNWTACYNSGDNVIALSCTVTTCDGSATISGVGLILNTSEGTTLASFYTDSSGGSETVNPALNLPPGGLNVGDKVWGVVSGECQEQHYFFEEQLTITKC
jgi:hypothetical protein